MTLGKVKHSFPHTRDGHKRSSTSMPKFIKKTLVNPCNIKTNLTDHSHISHTGFTNPPSANKSYLPASDEKFLCENPAGCVWGLDTPIPKLCCCCTPTSDEKFGIDALKLSL